MSLDYRSALRPTADFSEFFGIGQRPRNPDGRLGLVGSRRRRWRRTGKQNTRACQNPSSAATRYGVSHNGLRLSGERKRVRCSRGFGVMVLFARSLLKLPKRRRELPSESRQKPRFGSPRDTPLIRIASRKQTKATRAVPAEIRVARTLWPAAGYEGFEHQRPNMRQKESRRQGRAPPVSCHADAERLAAQRRAHARPLQPRVRQHGVQTGNMVYRFDRGHG